MSGLCTILGGQRVSQFLQVLNIMMQHHPPALSGLLREPLAWLAFLRAPLILKVQVLVSSSEVWGCQGTVYSAMVLNLCPSSFLLLW